MRHRTYGGVRGSLCKGPLYSIFHKTIDYLLKFIHPTKSGKLSLDDVCTVVIDVAEQEIERPIKKQKSYYSGKKNDIL